VLRPRTMMLADRVYGAPGFCLKEHGHHRTTTACFRLAVRR
jgi:hypothetical protein